MRKLLLSIFVVGMLLNPNAFANKCEPLNAWDLESWMRSKIESGLINALKDVDTNVEIDLAISENLVRVRPFGDRSDNHLGVFRVVSDLNPIEILVNDSIELEVSHFYDASEIYLSPTERVKAPATEWSQLTRLHPASTSSSGSQVSIFRRYEVGSFGERQNCGVKLPRLYFRIINPSTGYVVIFGSYWEPDEYL